MRIPNISGSIVQWDVRIIQCTDIMKKQQNQEVIIYGLTIM
jgi:hypothetical protein